MAEVRRKPCPRCEYGWWKRERALGPDGRGLVSVWECPNCGFTQPRQERKAGTEITPSQERTIESLIRRAIYDPARYEAKRREVSPLGSGGVFVLYLEVGVIGDETSALALFRDSYQFFISRNGTPQYYAKGRSAEGLQTLGPRESIRNALS